MTIVTKQRLAWFVLGGASLSLPACLGGGGSGDPTEISGAISGLSLPETVSIVTPEETTSGGATIGPGASTGGSAQDPGFPAGAEYNTDEAHTWVYDPSMEDLGIVNEILCMIGQTGYDRMVNEGAYRAQVDEGICQQGSQGGGDSEQGQSSGAGEEDISIWTVSTSRATSNSPQILRAWVPQVEEDETGPPIEGFIRAKMVIRNGVSATRPFGNFHMDFAMVPNGSTIDDPDMWGTLATAEPSTGDLGFRFYNNSGDVDVAHGPGEFSHRVRVNVQMDETRENGTARLLREMRYNEGGGDSGRLQQEFAVAFDSTHLKRQQDSGPVVTVSRGDFIERAWRYNLYHASGETAGERVERNSGFPFRTTTDDYGWMGYWGLWTEDDVSLQTGDTIIREEWGSDEQQNYTLVLAPGKLIRYSKHQMLLVDLAGEDFEWWEDTGGQQGTVQWLVEYSGGSWWRLASFDEQQREWVDLPSPSQIDTASIGWLGLWSQSLGGSVAYRHGENQVTFWSEEFVNGEDEIWDGESTEVTLYSYFQALKTGLTATEVEDGEIYLTDSFDPAQPHSYRFTRADLTLAHNDGGGFVPVGLASGQEPEQGPYMWGMRSGPMLLDTTGITDVGELWDAPEFYVYETGHNRWNQFAAVKDAQDRYVSFDPPLQFTYTHATANDRNDDTTYNGRRYLLNYNGHGDLWGIPQREVDLDNDSQPDRWYPVFSIADGTVVGPTGVEYVVRAIEIEQSLQNDPGGAPGLSLAGVGALELPDGSDYTAPDIGPKPEVNEPPAVVFGEVQGDGDE